jgi:iron complex transport system substrate-binding protein
MGKTKWFLGVMLMVLSFQQVVSQGAKRIVSLAPSFTNNIYYLNVQNKLVGCTSYCDTALHDKKEEVSSPVKVNVEKVVSMKPDLVLASSFTNVESIELLRKMGIRVEVLHTPKSFKGICEQFELLGDLVGKSNEARRIVKQSTARVEALQKAFASRKPLKVFCQIGAKPLFAVIPNTFMDDYIRYSGCVNIAASQTKGTITRESVISQNPDVIFVVTMGMVGEQEKMVWEGYPQLNATRRNQIFIIDSNLACVPTPITFVRTLELIHQLLTN